MTLIKCTLVLVTVMGLAAGQVKAQDLETLEHCFSAYAVSPDSVSQAERPLLQMTEDAYRFRTRIRSAWQGEVNFAGTFILVSWGCGTGCQSYGIINVQTGRASLLSLATTLGAEYRKESRLLIANPRSDEQEDLSHRPGYAQPEYYAFTSGSLIRIPSSEWRAVCGSD